LDKPQLEQYKPWDKSPAPYHKDAQVWAKRGSMFGPFPALLQLPQVSLLSCYFAGMRDGHCKNAQDSC
jgi:hypothetical protein